MVNDLHSFSVHRDLRTCCLHINRLLDR